MDDDTGESILIWSLETFAFKVAGIFLWLSGLLPGVPIVICGPVCASARYLNHGRLVCGSQKCIPASLLASPFACFAVLAFSYPCLILLYHPCYLSTAFTLLSHYIMRHTFPSNNKTSSDRAAGSVYLPFQDLKNVQERHSRPNTCHRGGANGAIPIFTKGPLGVHCPVHQLCAYVQRPLPRCRYISSSGCSAAIAMKKTTTCHQ